MPNDIREELHDLSHMFVEAKKWFIVARKFVPPILMKQADKWLNDIDAKLEDMMLKKGGPHVEKSNKLSKA